VGSNGRAENADIAAWSGLLTWWHNWWAGALRLAPESLRQNIDTGNRLVLFATTINQQATLDSGLEQRIITEVASYGKQLGRLVEAVDVLSAARHRPTGLSISETRALDELQDLAGDIRLARGGVGSYSEDHIIEGVRAMSREPDAHRRALRQIHELVSGFQAIVADADQPVVRAEGAT